VMGRRLGELLGSALPSRVGPVLVPDRGVAGAAPRTRASLAVAMSRNVGVLRSRAGLTEMLRLLESAPAADPGRLDLATVEATNLHAVSALVATAALARRDSVGAHRREAE